MSSLHALYENVSALNGIKIFWAVSCDIATEYRAGQEMTFSGYFRRIRDFKTVIK